MENGEKQNINLFSFILEKYEILDKSDWKDIAIANNIWDFSEYLKSTKFLSLGSLLDFIKEKGLEKELSNKRFLSFLLLFIDSNIHYFTEYNSLFIKDECDDILTNNKYTLLIAPENSITLQLDKIIALKRCGKGLRKTRYYNPKKTCHLLGMKHLNFVGKNNEYIIKQTFYESSNLANDLRNNIVNVTFAPFLRVNNDGNPLYRIKYSVDCFTILYNDRIDLYTSYLSNTFKKESSIIIFPELSMPTDNIQQISNLLKNINIDENKIVVAGTNWNKNDNIAYVFNDDGKVLATQSKFNAYFAQKDGEVYKEDLKNTGSPFVINLVNIKSFGLIGFPICSDLLSAKYIESIYCDCRVTNLICPCSSMSKDIFSSLPSLSSLFEITIFACNAFIGKNKSVGYISMPVKKKNNRRSFSEISITCKGSRLLGCVRPINKKIILSHYTK